MARNRSRSPSRSRGRSPSRSRSRSPVRRKRYDDPRDRRRERRSPAPTGLLVRNISLSARPEDLRIPFERYGPVKDVYLPKTTTQEWIFREPRGFGFVKFRYPEDAAEAKSHLNHTVIGGREIRIVFAEENRKTPHEMRRLHTQVRVGAIGDGVNHFHPDAGIILTHAPLRLQDTAQETGRKARDDYYSPRRSRSVSKSISPRDDRKRERSRRHSRSLSHSVSPRNEKNHSPNCRSPSPGENGKTGYAPSRSPSPRRNSRSPSRSRSRS